MSEREDYAENELPPLQPLIEKVAFAGLTFAILNFILCPLFLALAGMRW